MQLVPIALSAAVAGLCLASFLDIPHLAGGVAAAVCCLLWCFVRRSKWSGLYLFICCFCLANLYHQFWLAPHPAVAYLDALTGKIDITGTLVDLRQLSDGRSNIDLLVEEVRLGDRVVPLASPIGVRLYLEEGTDRFLPGDDIRVRCRLRKPRCYGTPGEFDWPRHLASQKIDMSGWLENAAQVEVDAEPHFSLQRPVSRWKRQVSKGLQSDLPERQACLVRALILGEARVLPDSMRKKLAESGTSHLFAISGLHLGMLALFGYRLLLLCYRRFPALLIWQPPQRVLPLLLVPLLLCYLWLTGDAIATRRAFFLAALVAVLMLRRHYTSSLRLLALLALSSLLFNPLLLWQAGWQLSFAGSAGILLWRPAWQQFADRDRLKRYLIQLFLVTSAATLATLPLVLMHFHLIAPAVVPANLLNVPVVTLIALPAGLLGLLTASFSPELSTLFFHFCGQCLDFLFMFNEWLIDVPGLHARRFFLSRWQYLAVCLGVLPLLLIFHFRSKKVRVSAAVFCFAGALILWQLPLKSGASVELTMFSVGQGESLLLRNESGQTILIDGGGLYSRRFDVGERLLAPALGAMAIDKLDAVVLTHDHPDHRKGLIYVLQYFKVGSFWSGLGFDGLHPDLRQVLADKKIPLMVPERGWHPLPFWKGGQLAVFNGAAPGMSMNNSSLVLYFRPDSTGGLLLTGDLEREGVTRLLDSGIPGPVDVLKLPHHGSQHSAAEKLIERLSPECCLVSVGYRNRYHFPAEQLMKHLEGAGVPLYRTDRHGTVQTRLTEHGWQVRHWERGLFR